MNDLKYNLTNPQKSILLTEQFHENTCVSNICGTLEIEEKIDILVLQRAINLFIKYNDSIRINLVNDDISIKQIVTEYKYVSIDVVELNDNYTLDELEQKIITKSFPLMESDLYHFTIFKNIDGTGGFVANLHHIISDAWTMSLLIDQIVDYYSYILKNNDEPILEKHFSYIDFIDSEKKYLESNKFEKSKLFWESQFEDLDFSYIRDSQSNSYDAIRKSFSLSKNQTNYIVEFCKNNNISLFALFMSVLSIYLSKINSTSSSTVGSPVLNRCNFNEKNTTGMFISTVPFHSDVPRDISCTEFLNYISKKEFSIFRNQKYPYNLLLDTIRKKHNMSKNLFDVSLSYQNARDHKCSSDVPYHTKWLFNNCIVNNLDIHIYDIDGTGLINIFYDFKKEIFEEKDIELLHERIFYIINQIIENPDRLIRDIDIVTLKEKDYLLNVYNNTNYSAEFISVYSMFKKELSKNPDKLAIKDGNISISYLELDNLSNYIASLLKSNSITKNDCVCLAFDDTIEFVASIIATQKIGACYIPIDIKYPNERINYIINHSKSKKILKKPGTLENLTINSNMILEIDIDQIDLKISHPVIKNTIMPDDLAYIIYTSGSTGKPKGVKITHQTLSNYISWAIKQYVGKEVTNFPLFSSVAFDLTVTSIYTPLCSGNSIYIYRNNNAELLLKEIVQDKKVQIIKMTPSYFSLLQDIELKDSILSKFILGGDILTKESCLKISNLFNHKIHIYNEYGPTEATVGCMIHEFNKHDSYSSVPIGIPIDNVSIYILNNEKELLPLGCLGEMYIGGNCLASGYTDEEKTKENFVDNPFVKGEKIYRTGDLAKLYSNGIMEYFGRIDFQVKLNGYRIELGEIQSSLLTHPLIKDAYVNVINIENHKILCAYYVSENEIADLERYLSDFLPNYMIPNHFIKTSCIPLTINGKIDSSKLPLPKRELKEYESPKNDLEKILQDIFTDFLELDTKISVNDNFFDYYIDSLILIKIQTALFSKGININTQNFYDYKTIRTLSDYLLNTNNKIAYSTEENYPDIKSIVHNLNTENYSYDNIVLFGATGFLGIHILYHLLKQTKSKVFCVIRDKNDINPTERLTKKLQFYFPDLDKDYFLNRIEIIFGNILDENLGISESNYDLLGKEADCVIDAAAIVKHYGNYDIFNQTNVNGTNKILSFCKKYNLPLHYISTMSVSGVGLVSTQKGIFDETNLYIGQNYKENVYVRSKFEAEKLVLEACKNDGLIASIYRIGTVTNRFNDGIFQENFEENAFLNRFSAFINLGIVPKELLSFPFEFTPVDYCANFIVNLMKHQNNNINVYHLFNDNYVTGYDLIKMFETLGISIEVVSIEDFKNKLTHSNSNYFGITNYISNAFNYNNVHIYNDITKSALNDYNLKWPEIDLLYISKMLGFLQTKNFIGGNLYETN